MVVVNADRAGAKGMEDGERLVGDDWWRGLFEEQKGAEAKLDVVSNRNGVEKGHVGLEQYIRWGRGMGSQYGCT